MWPVQKYVVKNPRQSRTLQVQVTTVEMVITMVMGTVMEDQSETENVMVIPMKIVTENTLVANHSLNDVNDRENFLLDIIAVD